MFIYRLLSGALEATATEQEGLASPKVSGSEYTKRLSISFKISCAAEQEVRGIRQGRYLFG